MLPSYTNYPFFEANQVLTNENLNQLRNYLDEQTRLSRANLLGIGIACGLEYTVEVDGSAIYINKGVAITSAGYLIPYCNGSDRLDYYKPYTVPDDIAYATFMNNSLTPAAQYSLWELGRDQNDNPDANVLSLDFLSGNNMPPGQDDEKVLLLFLECLAIDNKNCSPNSCDDKGKVIETTIRPLLIRRSDLDLIQQEVLAIGQPADEYFGLTGIMNLRNNLPELRMRRFNVESTNLVYSADVFNSFQSVLNQPFIDHVATALSDLYIAFQPVLQNDFPVNPFITLPVQWAYMHNGGIVAQNQHIWMQYFYDHIFTIIQAYNEFREKGLEVLGLCCPDERLFPRHVMLGIALPGTDNPDYRHHFAPSPLFSKYLGALSELLLLFRRITELIESLELPPQVGGFSPSGQNMLPVIKITPSRLGPYPLSKRAIPYHYQPIPLYEYWNPGLTNQLKASLNLGYRSTAWNMVNDFVINPLRYDYEENSFLRIEGHIGQPYIPVLQSLLQQKATYRLPFEIITLFTGQNAIGVPISNEEMSCNFQDLEAIYDTLREELLCHICEFVQYFYDTVIKNANGEPIVSQPGDLQTPNLTLLQNCAPNYQYRTGTVGAGYEANLLQLAGLTYPDLDQDSNNPLFNLSLLGFWSSFFGNSLPGFYVFHGIFLYYLVKLSESLSEDLSDLDLEDFTNKYQDVKAITNQLNDILISLLGDNDPEDPSQIQVDWDEVQDQLTNLMMVCKLEPILALEEEYQRRMEDIRNRYLLSSYSQKHPGLEHKAGVPKGGTFIVVVHGTDQSSDPGGANGPFTIQGSVLFNELPAIGANVLILGTTIGTSADNDGTFSLSVPQIPVTLVISYSGVPTATVMVSNPAQVLLIDLANPNVIIIDEEYPGLFQGQVIADFYLPYLCCSNCQPITFQLPPMPLDFTMEQVGCTVLDQAGTMSGSLRIRPIFGVPFYQYSIDGGTTWVELTDDPISVGNGVEIMIRDSAGEITGPQTVTLKEPLSIELGAINCINSNTEFTIEVIINGGRPPYTLMINSFSTVVQGGDTGVVTLASGEGGDLTVQDSDEVPCVNTVIVDPVVCPVNDCLLPCDGITSECDYLFWMQPPTDVIESPYSYMEVVVAVESFSVTGNAVQGGAQITRDFDAMELAELTSILDPGGIMFDVNDFNSFWQERIPMANDFIQSVLINAFGDDKGAILNWVYDTDALPGFAVLKIETYDCYTYEFVINANYFVFNGALRLERTTIYNKEEILITATSIIQGGAPVSSEGNVPRMNCVRRSRCQPGTIDNPILVEELCQSPLAPPEILPAANSSVTINFDLEVNPSDPVDFVYAECNHGIPAFSTALLTNFGLTPFQASTVLLRALVVNTGDTCASSNSHTVVQI